MTPETQLINLNEAIDAILNGAQEYRIGNRSIKRADLGTLITERQRLENQIASGNGIFYARFKGR